MVLAHDERKHTMAKLNKVHYDLIKENLIKTEVITKEQYDLLYDEPDAFVYIDQDKKTHSYVFRKVIKSDIDDQVINQYIQFKNYENIIKTRNLTRIIFVLFIIFLLLIIF